MPDHPSKDIMCSEGKELDGKRVALCITGSVAAVECVEIARTLMRHGAEVHAVMSQMSQKIIHPYLMHWATGNDVVTELTGRIEHVALGGDYPKRADVILVAPATANTISKIACGIDDTPVTSLVSASFGTHIPLIIVPAMHATMYAHPSLKENIRKLKALGVKFVEPRLEEGKAKIGQKNEILQAVIQSIAKQDMQGLKILITAGPTAEFIDPVRIITNRSSGKMGIALAEEALSRGAEVTLICGMIKISPPANCRIIYVETTAQMFEAVTSELKARFYRVLIAAAAPSDWAVEKPFPKKVSTHKFEVLDLKLKPTKKIIDNIKKTSPQTFLVAFRAEYKLTAKALIESAHARLMEADADLIVVNDIGKKETEFGSEKNEVFIVDNKKNFHHISLTSKREIARRILDAVKERIQPKQ